MAPHMLGLASLVVMLAVSAAGADDAGNDEFAGSRTETYKTIGDVALQIHIYEPEGHQASDHRPAIVFFFGGGWRNGSPRQFVQQCKYLASRGMVAMTADYRVSSRHGTHAKECVQDGKSAVRWVRTNAARLGIDPNRIAAGGGSAGGHVAACTGVLEGWDEPGEATAVSSAPNAMVLFNPALALAPFESFVPENEERTKDLPQRMGTDPINLSPAHHVRPALPPTVLFFGTEDFLLEGAREFDKQMKAAGNRCEFKLYDGQRHGFFNFGRDKNVYFEKTLADADRFLTSLGYLSGEGNVAGWMQANPSATPGRTRRD
jgi:acetyl esterase/lipase